MKLSCEVTQDLLPLYHDGVCSDESRALVEEHLKTCPDCAAILGELRGEIELPHAEPNEADVLKKLRKNVKRTWLKGAAAVLAVVLLAAAGRYGWWYVHDYRYYQQFVQGHEPVTDGSVDPAGNTLWLYEVDESGEILGAAQNTSNAYMWSEGGYDFHVCVPRWPGDGEMLLVRKTAKATPRNIVPGQEVTTWLSFGREEYAYCVGVEVTTRTAVSGEAHLKTETETVYILLDESLEQFYPEDMGAKTIEHRDAFYAEHRVEILRIIEAAQAQWPFLAEE